VSSGLLSVTHTHAVASTNRNESHGIGTRGLLGAGGLAYLIAYGLEICGLSISALFCAAIMTRAGGHQNGALLTACYLALSMIAAAAAIASAPKVMGRWGLARSFGVAIALTGLAMVALGVVILLGGPAPVVLLAFAPIVGALGGLAGVLNLIVARAFLGGEDMSRVSATMSVASGLAWGLGALIAGFGLRHVSLGVGPLVAGLLCFPMATLMVVRPPAGTMPEGHAKRSATMMSLVRRNARLRAATVVVGLICVVAIPMAALIVPIADQLRQTPLIPGAAIVLFAMSLGALLTPIVVRRMAGHGTTLRRAGAAVVACGTSMMVMAVAAQMTTGQVQLGIWFGVGIVFGAARFATRAFLLGAGVEAVAPENAVTAVAAVRFVSYLAAPIGVLVWGVLIHFISVVPVLYAGAIATLMLGTVTIWRFRREVPLTNAS